MCFSATASFTAAAVTGSLGLFALARTRQMHDLPLAATPVLFAAQQVIEGLIWLRLPMGAHGSIGGPLVLSYLIFAQVFWPIYAPVAVWRLEPDPGRRRLMLPWIPLGAAVSGYLLWGLLHSLVTATAGDMHVVYGTDQVHMTLVGAAYLAVVSVPLFMSSYRSVLVFGAIVTVGWLVAYAAYLAAFQSVWCFFAAAASVAVIGHFEVVRWQPLRLRLGA
ncbi:MAG TPA: DUF6629 family protein [Phenylobacterium sp.]|nr:DUF6629 family protein [Phenylobacterium sp.]